jgi:exonuclease SbcC
VAGEACPVCRQEVREVPGAVTVPDLDDATAALPRAADVMAAARRAAQEADTERARIVAKLEDHRTRLATLDAAVSAHPDPVAVEAALAEVAKAAGAVVAARTGARAARAALGEADAALAAIRQREVDARRVFDEARDRVAALGPPAADRSDVAADWATLVAWARQRAPELRAEADRSTAAAGRAEQERGALTERLAAACRDAGVPAEGNLLYACADALIRAETELERIDKAVAERDELVARAAALREQEQVASALGRHLDAKGFEKWVLDEALDGLVAGATVVLRELSGGQYSLTLDPKTSNFMVVDHRNADEQRSARTLSGGETFLASLALALALAEMTARGAAPLDAIFLDEGFGTLDADTLDTVAAAIEELGARGRMVGLVSHVQELADRVPVRFEVRKGPQTSTVEKVFA